MTRRSSIPILSNCTIDSKEKTAILIERLSIYQAQHRDMVFPHKHNFYHLVLFTQGSGSHIIDFSEYQILPYQIYFMRPGQVHTWKFAGDEDGFVVNFHQEYFQSFLLNTDYLQEFSFLAGQTSEAVRQIAGAHQALLRRLFEALLHLKTAMAHPDLCRVSLLQIFLYLEEWQEKKATLQGANYNYTIFRNYQQLVDRNFKHLKLPKEYAEMLYITPNHLNAICKDYVGMQAGEVIRNRILLESKRLLINKNLNINEIATELNFSDNSYFSKFFKKLSGQTPEEFRKLNS